MQRKLGVEKFVSGTIKSVNLVALNCLYQEENTCHRQSVC